MLAEALAQATKNETAPPPKSKNSPWKWILKSSTISIAVVGLFSSLISFFPNISITDPIQMDPTDLFSYQVSVSNGGVLPIFRVRWALSPRDISLQNQQGHKPVTLMLPHDADWIATDSLMASATARGSERHALLLFQPGGRAYVSGEADFRFHLRPSDNKIGTLRPGDQYTFTRGSD
jgi:hypothetical protein